VRRHDLDWVSLIAGAVFTGLALIYIVTGVADVTLDGRFVWPVVLVALGAAGVATAVKANQREEQQFPLATTDEQG
jgi:uncharacterized integral membrane protein